MSPRDKPLVWLHGQVQTPPFSREARIEAGYLLRMLQKGATLSMPHSRPMPSIARGCHELRINDRQRSWRIVYRIDHDAVLIADVFEKRTEQTPERVIDACRNRLQEYDAV
jgi:phage-related protein